MSQNSPAPLPASTANWHWKNKNVTNWGHDWFRTALTSIKVSGQNEGESVWVSDVSDIDGDIELGQRKSKLITIFDCRLVVHWAGITQDGSEVKGRIDIPEVSHENTVDMQEPYVYHWSMSSDSNPQNKAVYTLAKSRLPALMEEVFRRFPTAMLEVHGGDLTVQGSGANTPVNSSRAPSHVPSPVPTPGPQLQKNVAAPKGLNTTTVVVEGTFAASADDLFSLLTDEKRIPVWSRAAAKSAAKPDTEYSLFSGGVKGRYVSLTPPSEIVQTWGLASPTWPVDHAAQMTTTFEQSSDSTKVTFTIAGVPLGMKDEIKRNIEGYYIQGFKSIGLGTSL